MASLFDASLRHATHYADVLRDADKSYQEGGESTLQALNAFDLEWENIRSGQSKAQDYASSDGRAAELCNRYPMLGANLLNLRFNPQEHIRWIEIALESARRLGDRESEAIHLSNLGLAYEDIGDLQRGLERQQQSLTIAREVGDRYTEETTLGNLGAVYQALN